MALGMTLLWPWFPGAALAVDKLPAVLLVTDALTAPNQPATIEATLIMGGASGRVFSGEPVELVVDGHVVATATTGEQGVARLVYTPKSQGALPVRVRVGDGARVASAEAGATLSVWERRNPILVIEWAALGDTAAGQPAGPAALPDAAEELAKLTQFLYRVVYVLPAVPGGDPFQQQAEARAWLLAHQFPPGYLVTLSSGEQALGQQIDAWLAAGWRTVKLGIGRTKAFAEAFLQRRFDAVLVPEPAPGEAPRKAKVAKTWKEIRKKL